VRFDLHNHTRYSPDSRVAPRTLVATAVDRGLHGIAITDHNSIGGVREAEEAAPPDFLVVSATEVSAREGHVLAFGVREAIPRDLSAAETIERIVALGGVPVAAHPYRFWSGLGQETTLAARFRAYETANARTLRGGNRRAKALAHERGVGETGGSDSHFLDEVGGAATFLESGPLSAESVLQAIGQGRTSVQGQDRGAAATGRYVTKCVGEWIVRGMRRI